MSEMDVEIVAVEREVWSGKAKFVFTRTTSGEIGIMPRHIPLVAQLVEDAAVKIEREGQDDLWWAIDGGFLSISDNRVSLLVESAQARSDIDETKSKADSQSEDPRVAASGRARLRALGQTV